MNSKTAHWNLLLAAWLLALLATLAALFIGEVMGMTPCVLCWYQRIFMFPIAIVLGLACYLEDRRGAIYALPLALGGLLVAGYHCALLLGLLPPAWVPCGAGVSCTNQKLDIFWGIEMPWLSLLSFAGISGLLALYLKRTSSP